MPTFEPLWFCALRSQLANLRERLRGQSQCIKYAIINNNSITKTARTYILFVYQLLKILCINVGIFIIILYADGRWRAASSRYVKSVPILLL